jgi:hypothetical protein
MEEDSKSNTAQESTSSQLDRCGKRGYWGGEEAEEAEQLNEREGRGFEGS